MGKAVKHAVKALANTLGMQGERAPLVVEGADELLRLYDRRINQLRAALPEDRQEIPLAHVPLVARTHIRHLRDELAARARQIERLGTGAVLENRRAAAAIAKIRQMLPKSQEDLVDIEVLELVARACTIQVSLPPGVGDIKSIGRRYPDGGQVRIVAGPGYILVNEAEVLELRAKLDEATSARRTLGKVLREAREAIVGLETSLQDARRGYVPKERLLKTVKQRNFLAKERKDLIAENARLRAESPGNEQLLEENARLRRALTTASASVGIVMGSLARSQQISHDATARLGATVEKVLNIADLTEPTVK